MSESVPTNGTDNVKVDPFFSSVLEWLTKVQVISDEGLETLRQDAEVRFTKEQRKAFATA
jgi:hypothetical protein